jgi:sulfoxide reductase catalytic subunit YedY
MNFFVRRAFDLPQRLITPEDVYRNKGVHRREFLAAMGIGSAGLLLDGCQQKVTKEELQAAGATEPPLPVAKSVYPAPRNDQFEYGRPETNRDDAAAYTNFYEFSESKQTFKYTQKFRPSPWEVVVDGLCSKPTTFDLDKLQSSFSFEERCYRHRCVETWAMCVPWTGFPLKDLIAMVEPQPAAKFVRFETFNRPEEAPNIDAAPHYPWPYTEGLTLEEATNELTLIATGIYGAPLPKQHGAPVRLVVPWKYGFKGIKSIVRITLTDEQPTTFWNTIAPREYDFQANVNPKVPHPRWSQRYEWMLPNRSNRYETVIYNGYGEYVAKLYA